MNRQPFLLTLLLITTLYLVPGSAYAQTYVYFSAPTSSSIPPDGVVGRIDIASGLLEPLFTGETAAVGIETEGDKVYWVEQFDRSIKRADLDGNNVEVVLNTSTTSNPILSLIVQGFTIDSSRGKMYWSGFTTSGESVVQRANLDGTGFETILDLPGVEQGLAVDEVAGKLYVATGSVWRTELDGTNPDQILLVNIYASNVVVSDALYWSGAVGVGKAGFDGSNPQLIIPFADFEANNNGLGVDEEAGKIYWTRESKGLIQRSNLDGTEEEDFFSGIPRVRFLAVGGVLTTNQLFEMTTEDVVALVDGGVLDTGQGTALNSKLARALGKLQDGKSRVALNLLSAFINQVESFVDEGVLSADEGQELIDAANAIIAQIEAEYGKTDGAFFTESVETPLEFALQSAYPNPFNPTTTISFTVPVDGEVTIDVFDIAGRHVGSLLNTTVPVGTHRVVFDAEGLPSGPYLVRMDTEQVRVSKQILLVK